MWCRHAWDANAWEQSVKSRSCEWFSHLLIEGSRSGEGIASASCRATVCCEKMEHRSNTKTILQKVSFFLRHETRVKNKFSLSAKTYRYVVHAKKKDVCRFRVHPNPVAADRCTTILQCGICNCKNKQKKNHPNTKNSQNLWPNRLKGPKMQVLQTFHK